MFTHEFLVSDIAIFVLKRDVKLQLTNLHTNFKTRMLYNLDCHVEIEGLTGVKATGSCVHCSNIWVQTS